MTIFFKKYRIKNKEIKRKRKRKTNQKRKRKKEKSSFKFYLKRNTKNNQNQNLCKKSKITKVQKIKKDFVSKCRQVQFWCPNDEFQPKDEWQA